MWLVNFVQGKNCLLEKTCRVTVGGRNLPGGSSETTPTCINPSLRSCDFYRGPREPVAWESGTNLGVIELN
jgi:hypothetical protein